jgi:predicted phage gp36 major capsid-like protein
MPAQTLRYELNDARKNLKAPQNQIENIKKQLAAKIQVQTDKNLTHQSDQVLSHPGLSTGIRSRTQGDSKRMAPEKNG